MSKREASKADVLLHPVRLRIVMTLLSQPMTALELSDALPDVGQATVYRHIKKLEAADLLSVVEERQAHSNMEKVYGVGRQQAHLLDEDLAGLSTDEHLQMFMVFVLTLLRQFEGYLNEAPEPNYANDHVGYTQVPLWLTDEEFATLVQDINAAVGKVIDNGPGDGREQHHLTTVVMKGKSS